MVYTADMQTNLLPCFMNFRLPPDLFRRLDGAARSAGVTRAELLRRQIERLEAVEVDARAIQEQAA